MRRKRIRLIKQKSPRGRKPKGSYKSGYEKRTADQLTAAGVPFTYEAQSYEYLKVHVYTPDWKLNNKFTIETKGKFVSEDRSKHLLIKQQHPELEVRFLFMRDNTLSKKSSTRYSDWCIKHGFQFAIGEVPQRWIDEALKK